MSHKFRVLAGMMYCGEPQYEKAKASVLEQADVNISLFTIEGKRNREAHDELYQRFQHDEDHDFYLKVDADMVLAGPNSVAEMLRLMTASPDVDLASFTLKDFFTDDEIWGINLFSNRCNWPRVSDGLFVDKTPNFPGKRLKVKLKAEPIAYHCPDPSLEQAYLFGVHRAMKVIQANSTIPRLGESYGQWQTLRKVQAAYANASDGSIARRAREHVLLGANDVFNRRHPDLLISKMNMTIPDLPLSLSPTSERWWRGITLWNWILCVGPLRMLAGLFSYAFRKLWQRLSLAR